MMPRAGAAGTRRAGGDALPHGARALRRRRDGPAARGAARVRGLARPRLGRGEPDPRHAARLREVACACRPSCAPRCRAPARTGCRCGRRRRRRRTSARFLPALERNLDLRHQYVECFDPGDEPYDILLDDYERGMKTAEVRADLRRAQGGARPADRRRRASRRRSTARLDGRVPDRRAARDLLRGAASSSATGRTRGGSTRRVHPFASGGGIDDIRITTHYEPDDLDSLFATMHEYGHGLYEHQVAAELDRGPLGSGVSLGLHESQSRMWENLVGRCAAVLAVVLPAAAGDVPGAARRTSTSSASTARSTGCSRRSSASMRTRSPTTCTSSCASSWSRRSSTAASTLARPAGGVEPADGRVPRHRGPGRRARASSRTCTGRAASIGYFPTYSLGNVMSVQIWERLRGGRARPRRAGRARRVRRRSASGWASSSTGTGASTRRRRRSRRSSAARSTRRRTSATCARSTGFLRRDGFGHARGSDPGHVRNRHRAEELAAAPRPVGEGAARPARTGFWRT